MSGKILVLRLWSKMLFPIKLQDSSKCNTSRKRQMMKFIYCLQINIEVFYNLILSFWVFVASHAQSTQNNKFAISLQYLKEIREWWLRDFYLQISIENSQNNKLAISLQYLKNEVDFLHADNRASFVQIDAMIFDWDGQAFLELPK